MFIELDTLNKFWALFSKISIIINGHIQHMFLHFPKGTHREII